MLMVRISAKRPLDLNAEETLFIVCSKTFTTLETMTNAATARDWLVERLGSEAAVREALRGSPPPISTV